MYVDGSVLEDGRSGCGGAIMSGDGAWISGFSCKLIKVPSVIAELLGCLHGLQLSWIRCYSRNSFLFSDCREAINFLLRGCKENHLFPNIISDVRLIMNRDWSIKLYRVYREHSKIAEHLAKISHSLDVSFVVFYQQPPDLFSGGG